MARGEPASKEQARALLMDAHAAFEEMSVPRYAVITLERLQELGSAEESAMGRG